MQLRWERRKSLLSENNKKLGLQDPVRMEVKIEHFLFILASYFVEKNYKAQHLEHTSGT